MKLGFGRLFSSFMGGGVVYIVLVVCIFPGRLDMAFVNFQIWRFELNDSV